jgi:hypothetical protein
MDKGISYLSRGDENYYTNFEVVLMDCELPLCPLSKELPATGIAQRSTTLFDLRLWATPVAGCAVGKLVPPSNNITPLGVKLRK